MLEKDLPRVERCGTRKCVGAHFVFRAPDAVIFFAISTFVMIFACFYSFVTVGLYPSYIEGYSHEHMRFCMQHVQFCIQVGLAWLCSMCGSNRSESEDLRKWGICIVYIYAWGFGRRFGCTCKKALKT